MVARVILYRAVVIVLGRLSALAIGLHFRFYRRDCSGQLGNLLLGSPTGPTLARAALVLSFVALITLSSFPFVKDLLPLLLRKIPEIAIKPGVDLAVPRL